MNPPRSICFQSFRQSNEHFDAVEAHLGLTIASRLFSRGRRVNDVSRWAHHRASRCSLAVKSNVSLQADLVLGDFSTADGSVADGDVGTASLT